MLTVACNVVYHDSKYTAYVAHYEDTAVFMIFEFYISSVLTREFLEYLIHSGYDTSIS
jgi:hypothetical protein